jgi:hypothetical protein
VLVIVGIDDHWHKSPCHGTSCYIDSHKTIQLGLCNDDQVATMVPILVVGIERSFGSLLLEYERYHSVRSRSTDSRLGPQIQHKFQVTPNDPCAGGASRCTPKDPSCRLVRAIQQKNPSHLYSIAIPNANTKNQTPRVSHDNTTCASLTCQIQLPVKLSQPSPISCCYHLASPEGKSHHQYCCHNDQPSVSSLAPPVFDHNLQWVCLRWTRVVI